MTCARTILIPPDSTGTLHWVSRGVRWALLCSEEQQTGRWFAYRRRRVEDRIQLSADTFGVID